MRFFNKSKRESKGKESAKKAGQTTIKRVTRPFVCLPPSIKGGHNHNQRGTDPDKIILQWAAGQEWVL